MDNKGLTLAEMLLVVFFLALITVIMVPNITGLLQKSSENEYQSFLSSLYLATEAYIQANNDIEFVDNSSCVKIIDLVKANYLKSTTYNPKTKQTVLSELNDYVKITLNNDNTYDYKYLKECSINNVAEKQKIYGIKRKIDNSSSSWERIEDSVGLVANAQFGTDVVVRNDFDVIYPWSEIKSYNYNTETNRVTAWYGDDNFKFDGSNGEVLTRIPEFYYKREQKDGYEYIYITKNPKEGYTKSEEFSVGRYTMSGAGLNDVHSMSGKSPLANKTITEFRNYARSMGNNFGQMDYHYFILQMLYLVEYADYNSQAKLGLGYTNSSNKALITSGGCDELGMKSGTINSDGFHSMIYRGIEDIYGNVWQFVDGINIKDHQTYICYDQSNYASDKFDGCYKKIGYVNTDTTGYISKLGYDSSNPLVALPTAAGGSDSTYINDYYYRAGGNQIALVGGKWNDGLYCGLWHWSVNIDSSYSRAYSVSRLIKIN